MFIQLLYKDDIVQPLNIFILSEIQIKVQRMEPNKTKKPRERKRERNNRN